MASTYMKQGLSQSVSGAQGVSSPKPMHLKTPHSALTRSHAGGVPSRRSLLAPVRAAGVGAAGEVPDMEKRKTMNLVLAGGGWGTSKVFGETCRH
eukprot:1134300-Pelagomonas_calceolata.AAC.2